MRDWRAFVGLMAAGLMFGCSSPAGKAALREPVTIGFESPLNLIVVEARINGEGPFRFPLDSGTTGTVVDAELARRLDLALGPETTRGGTVAGSRVTSASVRGGLAFELAPGFEVPVDSVIAAPVTRAKFRWRWVQRIRTLAQIQWFEHVD